MSGMEWRPIETAPKTERRVIIWSNDGMVHIAERVGDIGWEFDGEVATHWMPLPPPPSSSDQTRFHGQGQCGVTIPDAQFGKLRADEAS
jgi:hypothetical protein